MSGSQILASAIGESVPQWLIPAFVVVTHLGNVGFLLAIFVVDYWVGDHERGAHALGVALAGMALVVALKALFAEPRPPEPDRLVAATGYSFPSGHATTSTVAYGILAFDLEIGTRRVRFAVASVLVALIALSRVVLRVHFVRDVVAGVVVGVAFLTVAVALTRHAPRPGFLLAVGLGLVAFVVSGASPHGVAIFGATVGAVVAWEWLDGVPSVESPGTRLTLLGGVLPVTLCVGYVASYWSIPLVAVFVLDGAAIAAILTAPRLLEWFD